MHKDAIIGSILGTAIGDALGLPYEGVSRDRAKRMFGPATKFRFFIGKGMVSDDTEHTCMVAQSLIESHISNDTFDVEIFSKRLAWRIRWWLVALPAGVGKATAKSGIRLWLGFKPDRAGVFSAGNGPAMRSAILGATIEDQCTLLQLVKRSACLTHSDPKATIGAIVIAFAAREARQCQKLDRADWLSRVEEHIGVGGGELVSLLKKCGASVGREESTRQFAEQLGLAKGISGYTYHTVPTAIHAWLSHPNDLRQAICSIIECGGDADTTAAIVGGIVGAGVGSDGIPNDLLEGIFEWPRTIGWMETLGENLASALDVDGPGLAPSLNPIGLLFRNLFFLAVVLFHGFRRLAPPY